MSVCIPNGEMLSSVECEDVLPTPPDVSPIRRFAHSVDVSPAPCKFRGRILRIVPYKFLSAHNLLIESDVAFVSALFRQLKS